MNIYNNKPSHHIAGNKYIENLSYPTKGQNSHNRDITTVAVITIYSIKFITTVKKSSKEVLSKVDNMSCFNSLKNTPFDHSIWKILSLVVNHAGWNIAFSDILDVSKESDNTSIFVTELFLSIKNFWES